MPFKRVKKVFKRKARSQANSASKGYSKGYGKGRFTKSGGGGSTRAWSNSVGSRYSPRTWVNPTLGEGKTLWNQKTANTPEATACLEVALNAFSDATMQPRFPDGKASESVGMKYQMINEVEQQANKGVMEIMFFPGLNGCTTVKNATSKSLGAVNSTANSALSKFQRVTNHVTGLTTLAADNAITFEQQAERHVAKWRGVSYAMLLSLVNNSEENDGWWEACRITMSSDVDEYMASLDITPGVSSQPFNVFPDIPNLTSSEMLNSASYCTGKLRNIHNVLFQLNPEYEDHDFVDLTRKSELRLDPTPNSDIGQPFDTDTIIYKGNKLLSGSSNRVNDESVSQFVDHTYDGIFIRIHGVEPNPATGRSASRLTMHTVMNQEIVYDEKALNAKFHQPAVLHTGYGRIKGSPSAGQPADVQKRM